MLVACFIVTGPIFHSNDCNNPHTTYLFVYSLFHVAASNSGYTKVNDTVISE
jgi:hypothetical protein